MRSSQFDIVIGRAPAASMADTFLLPQTRVRTKTVLYTVSAALFVIFALVALRERSVVPRAYLPTHAYLTPSGLHVEVDNNAAAPRETCFRAVLTNRFSPYLFASSEAMCTVAIPAGAVSTVNVPLTQATIDHVCTFSRDPWSNCVVTIENLFPPEERQQAPGLKVGMNDSR